MFVSKHNGLISANSLYFIDQFKDRKQLNQKSLRSSQLSFGQEKKHTHETTKNINNNKHQTNIQMIHKGI